MTRTAIEQAKLQRAADEQAKGAWWCPDLDQHRCYEHADGQWYCDACMINLGGFKISPRAS